MKKKKKKTAIKWENEKEKGDIECNESFAWALLVNRWSNHFRHPHFTGLCVIKIKNHQDKNKAKKKSNASMSR